MATDNHNPVTHLTSEIVSAYLSNHKVHKALVVAPAAAATPAPPVPAVPINKSITPDFIISLEDGRKFKSMRRYLRGLGMMPDEYRAKWGLPGDYPMVAPNYAKTRSELAKRLGLGRKPTAAAPAEKAPRLRKRSARK
jgi:predicted transcriptional regulator